MQEANIFNTVQDGAKKIHLLHVLMNIWTRRTPVLDVNKSRHAFIIRAVCDIFIAWPSSFSADDLLGIC